jgi:hypothetical protein
MQLPQPLVDSWTASPPPAQLHLPPPNPYIATDFSLKAKPVPAPIAVADTNGNGTAMHTASGDGGAQADEQAKDAAAALSNGSTRGSAEAELLAKELGLPIVLAVPPRMVADKPGAHDVQEYGTCGRGFKHDRMLVVKEMWHCGRQHAAQLVGEIANDCCNGGRMFATFLDG